MEDTNYGHHTLCWDCANACFGCSWSCHFEPVEGWVATPTQGKVSDSFIVHKCPQFKRDAYEGGTKRMKKREVTE